LLATIASERLGVPLEQVTVALGDTALPPAGISGGSSTTTSLANALAEACVALRRQPREGAREVRMDWVPPGGGDATLAKLREGRIALATAPADALGWTFGAHMVEVRVDAVTGEVRVARHVGAFAAGRIVNPLAARSQYLGGMIWGQGSALMEATEVDARTAAYANATLAEYHFPTAADIGDMEVLMIPDDDTAVNPEGVKGLGEIGIIGVAAAVANAVFNATGVRARNLPLRLDALLY
jgi:xanthine dehydrogenase YagR molybdenum-binding subunit